MIPHLRNATTTTKWLCNSSPTLCHSSNGVFACTPGYIRYRSTMQPSHRTAKPVLWYVRFASRLKQTMTARRSDTDPVSSKFATSTICLALRILSRRSPLGRLPPELSRRITTAYRNPCSARGSTWVKRSGEEVGHTSLGKNYQSLVPRHVYELLIAYPARQPIRVGNHFRQSRTALPCHLKPVVIRACTTVILCC